MSTQLLEPVTAHKDAFHTFDATPRHAGVIGATVEWWLGQPNSARRSHCTRKIGTLRDGALAAP